MKDIVNSGRVKAVMYVLVTAVVRILDIGGWLDTWFAVFGDIFSLGVYSRLFCSEAGTKYRGVDALASRQVKRGKNGRMTIIAGDPAFDIGVPISDLLEGRVHDNLILAMLSLLPIEKLLPNEKNKTCDIEIRIMSPFRPGASVGTSAAVAVVVGMAINELLAGLGYRRISAKKLAKLAWQAETRVLRKQSGTQDQGSAAEKAGFRAINVPEYPETSVEVFGAQREICERLLAGLITVEVGPHVSTVEHGRVIKEQEGKGPQSPELQRLRPLASRARKKLEAGDLEGLGRVMQANTRGQMALCRGLVGPDHQRIIELASVRSDCYGWKVNGAGGDGGSITLLFASRKAAVAFYHAAKQKFADDDFWYYEHSFAA